MQRSLIIVVLVLFGALSAAAVWNHGYWGIVSPFLRTYGGGQVLADVVIALSLVLTWMKRDAKRTGRRYWPWLVLTVTTGSFGPLFYLLTRKAGPDHR
ncbi:MAG: DUF2834 domain-containing protein [Acidobacteria bacterium]|nr:DUF2834 domain-containing protein [Acidobacteriota bacterium]